MSEIEHGTIERQRVIDAITALGVKPDDVKDVHIDAYHVGLTLFARGEDGRRIVLHGSEQGFQKRRLALGMVPAIEDGDAIVTCCGVL